MDLTRKEIVSGAFAWSVMAIVCLALAVLTRVIYVGIEAKNKRAEALEKRVEFLEVQQSRDHQRIWNLERKTDK